METLLNQKKKRTDFFIASFVLLFTIGILIIPLLRDRIKGIEYVKEIDENAIIKYSNYGGFGAEDIMIAIENDGSAKYKIDKTIKKIKLKNSELDEIYSTIDIAEIEKLQSITSLECSMVIDAGYINLVINYKEIKKEITTCGNQTNRIIKVIQKIGQKFN